MWERKIAYMYIKLYIQNNNYFEKHAVKEIYSFLYYMVVKYIILSIYDNFLWMINTWKEQA